MNRTVTFDDVVEINRLHTNGNGVLVDANTVMSAVGRPWQAFGAELYPTLIEKAAALLMAWPVPRGSWTGTSERRGWPVSVSWD